MPHKRCRKEAQRRLARMIILSSSFRDRVKCESVSTLSRADVLGLLTGLVDVDVVPDVVVGEVLMDSRGEGSFQG
jgi:hypothetical protein